MLRVRGHSHVSLRELCRHKALFSRLRWDRPAGGWPGRFERWLAEEGCDGVDDPRCLPLYVFEEQGWSKPLLTATGRSHFDGRFGGGQSRNDRRRRLWKRGPPHGRTCLTVAGAVLPTGFHWDVNAPRNPVELWTMKGGWTIDNYLNVSPDANVRSMPKHARPIRLER